MQYKQITGSKNVKHKKLGYTFKGNHQDNVDINMILKLANCNNNLTAHLLNPNLIVVRYL